MTNNLTASFYKFVAVGDVPEFRDRVDAICREHGLLGTVLVAAEGINGTVAGTTAAIHAALAALRQDPHLADLEHKEAAARAAPFRRLKVRIKREIVTLGTDVDAANEAGTYVAPQDWNALISDPDVVVIDARNDYEVDIGRFRGARNPNTASFRDLPAWLEAHPDLEEKPKVAMYCTGGIRCEKSTALLRSQGFEDVYHLHGGILRYLAEVPPAESLFDGECFVFDERVSVRHGLKPGRYALCRGCRHPIDADDRASPHYVAGVCCPRCHDDLSPQQKAAFAERQKQMELAAQRDGLHLGQQLKQVREPT